MRNERDYGDDADVVLLRLYESICHLVVGVGVDTTEDWTTLGGPSRDKCQWHLYRARISLTIR